MSVMMLGKKEFANIGVTILENDKLSEAFPSEYEKLEEQILNVADDPQNRVYCFMDRLYIANQIAFCYNYRDASDDGKMLIERLDEEDFLKAEPLSTKKLIDGVRCVRYNLYTNNGRAFLYDEDMERLRRLLDAARDLLIENLENPEIKSMPEKLV